MNKQFLFDVFNLAEQHCGTEFHRKLLLLRQERERILNNVWKKEPLPEDLSDYEKAVILRSIDFDTIIHHAAKCIDKAAYNLLLYKIAETAVKHGEFQRGREILRLVLKNAGQKDKGFTANILRKLGNIEFYTNNFQAAQKYFIRSLNLFTRLDDKAGIVSIKNVIGALMVEQGKYYEGEIRFIQARKMAEEIQLPEMIAKANMNLGNIYDMRGLSEDAIKCYQKALDVNKDEDKELSTDIYINFAITYKFKRSYDRSIDYLNKALETNKETNIRYQKGLIYLTQGEIACLQKNLSAATALVTSAFTIFSDIGDRLSIGEAYKILGMINHENENYDVALSYFENSKQIYEKITNPISLAETLVEMAKLFSDMGEKSRAKITINQAIKNFRKIGADSKIDSAKTFFADIL